MLHEVLADGTGGKRRKVLHCRRCRRASDHDHGESQRSFFLELCNRPCNAAALLPDRAVDTDDLRQVEVFRALVDDGVHREGGLSRVAVPDDKLALAPADGREGVHHFHARLQRHLHGCPFRDPRRDTLQRHGGSVRHGERLAVQGGAERVDDPAQEIFRHVDGKGPAGALHLGALREVRVLRQDEHGGEILVEIHDKPATAVLEFHLFPETGAG